MVFSRNSFRRTCQYQLHCHPSLFPQHSLVIDISALRLDYPCERPSNVPTSSQPPTSIGQISPRPSHAPDSRSATDRHRNLVVHRTSTSSSPHHTAHQNSDQTSSSPGKPSPPLYGSISPSSTRSLEKSRILGRGSLSPTMLAAITRARS